MPIPFVDLLKEMFLLVLLLSGLPLAVTSLSGLIVATLQAATQIQEQTTPFFVKFLSFCAVAALCGPWFFERLVLFCREVIAGAAAAQF